MAEINAKYRALKDDDDDDDDDDVAGPPDDLPPRGFGQVSLNSSSSISSINNDNSNNNNVKEFSGFTLLTFAVRFSVCCSHFIVVKYFLLSPLSFTSAELMVYK